ncbi:MAG: uracil-DNA glycosylase [Thermoguttaceae bacterium]|nr:uracil-DNA glycosylase [Thermoguttaceae bacterium]
MNLRHAILQRLQSLQCAGIEEISRTEARKLAIALKENEAKISPAPVSVSTGLPADSRSSGQKSPGPQTSHSSRETTSQPSSNVMPWQRSMSSPPSSGSKSTQYMAPKRTALSLEIIVPPHEDYSALPLMEDRHEALRLLGEKVRQCVRCIELVSNRTQTVLGVGNPYAELMFLGEAPGADEDRQGIPFVGRAGQLLTKMIENGMKIKREEDTYICNILRCRPPGNRAPMPEEAFKCRQFLDTQIDIVKPKFICCLGASAAQYLLDTTTTISRMRQREYRYRNATVVCTYHPAYLLRNPSQKAATWQDLQFLMKLMGLKVEND